MCMALPLAFGRPLALGKLYVGGHQFFGVIDSDGFDSFRIEEIDGKVGQEQYVFGDDFVFATGGSLIFSDGFETADLGAWSSGVAGTGGGG